MKWCNWTNVFFCPIRPTTQPQCQGCKAYAQEAIYCITTIVIITKKTEMKGAQIEPTNGTVNPWTLENKSSYLKGASWRSPLERNYVNCAVNVMDKIIWRWGVSTFAVGCTVSLSQLSCLSEETTLLSQMITVCKYFCINFTTNLIY